MIVDELIYAFKFQGGTQVGDQIKKVSSEISKAEKELEKLEKQYAKTGKAEDKFAVESAKKMLDALKQQEAQLKRTSLGLERFKKGLGQLGSGLRGLNDRAANAALIGIGGAAAVATASVVKLSSEADRIKNVAAALGITTDAFQELEFAAKKNGLTTEQLQMGLRQMAANLRMVGVSGGKGEAAGALKQLGLNFEELIRLSPDQQLRKIADAAQKYGNSAQRNAALARIFGEEAGAKFSELVNGGAKGLDELAAAARRYGTVLNTETLESADELAESLTDTKQAVLGVTLEIGKQLLPVAKEITEQVRAWLVNNRALLGQRVREWVTKIRDASKPLIPVFRDLVKWIGEMLDKLAKTSPETVKMVAQLGLLSVAGSKLLPVVKDLGTAIGGLFNILRGASGAALANPITAILVAFTAALPLAWRLGDALGDIIGKTDTLEITRQRSTALSRVQRNRGVAGLRADVSTLSSEQVEKLLAADIKRTRDLVSAGGLKTEVGGVVGFDRAATSREYAVLAERRKIFESELEAIRERENLEQFKKDTAEFEAQEQRRKEAKDNEARLRRDAAKLAGLAGQGQGAIDEKEIAKLISEAAKSGQNLDQLLKGRKIAGGAPPVINVTVNNQSVNVGGIEIEVKSPNGVSALEVARSTVNEFETRFNEQVLRKASRGGPKVEL